MRPFLLAEGLLDDGHGDSGRERESSPDDLKRDLGLPILFDAMAAADEFVYGAAESVVLSGAADVETILYRQAVLGDCLKNRDVVRELYALIGETLAEEKKSSLWFSHQSPSTVLHTAIGALDVLLSALGRIRDILNARSSGFASPGFTTLIRTLNVEIDDDFLGYARNHLHDLKFGGGILVGAEMGVGCKGRNYRALKSARKGMTERLRERKDSLIIRIPDGDEAGSRALEELRDRGINRVADSLARSRDHVLGFLSSMRFELAFYIGCIDLQERLAALGLGLSLPLPARPEERAHSGKGLYDICLALTLGRPVIGNDLEADGRGLIVVTGANQGGKSTFLRSVGLAQLMMQCGMFVPAEKYRANLCASLFTHFRREEDAAMESGKLDEELRRLSGIVDDLRENSMLLFNEPFASTNEREGSEIARRIVGALLERRVKVFFVTHLYDFAATVFKQGEAAALFLRAERREDGTRSYRILAGEPLETSFGKDLYAEVFSILERRSAAELYEEKHMLEADIPGFGRIEIEYLASDFTGTLSRDGSLIRGVAGHIRKVSRFLDIRVLTFDTFGTAERELRGLPCSVLVLSGERGDEQKRDYIARLGPERVVAIGNGANDSLMLSIARIGITVFEAEERHAEAVAVEA